MLAFVLVAAAGFSTVLPAFASGSSGRLLSIENGCFPDELYEGETFFLSGTVRGTTRLGTVIVRICDAAGKRVQLKSFRVRAKAFNLFTANRYIDFEKLSCSNTYVLTVEVKNNVNGWVTLVRKNVTVMDPYVSTGYAETESNVLTFSLKEDGNRYIARNFRIKEFACKDGSDTILVDRKLVALLQQIRDHFNAPVNITSGYRTPSHNANTPNAKSGSYHTRGMAADFWVSGVSSLEVCLYAEELGVNGIGWYASDSDGHFSHLDTRSRSNRFYWRTQNTIGVSSFSVFD